MKPCPTNTYEVTPEQFAALVEKARENHLFLTGTGGTTSLHGCTFDWVYANGILVVTCTGHPFFVGCDTVNEALGKMLAL